MRDLRCNAVSNSAVLRPEWWVLCLTALLLCPLPGCHTPGGQSEKAGDPTPASVQPGAEVLIEEHRDELQGQQIAIVAHAASMVYDSVHVVDTLLGLGADIRKIFAPEHGFRGNYSAGATVQSGRDSATGLPIVSLYGNNKRPDPAELKNIDLVLFDIQDVGTRFYTYLSTMTYMMTACARTDTDFWLLDRPNPNGQTVAGPMMQPAHTSFVGLHEIPLVHGMTLGEYASMVNNLGWLASEQSCPLRVIEMAGYRHAMRWRDTGLPWHPPSPNLRSPLAAELYPALAWFEGTPVSVGRGTDAPFTRLGFPEHSAAHIQWIKDTSRGTTQQFKRFGTPMQAEYFIPRSQPGRARNPKYEGDTCWGYKLTGAPPSYADRMKMGLSLLKNFLNEYQEYYQMRDQPPPAPFFKPYFTKLVGNQALARRLRQGQPLAAIHSSWQQPLKRFKAKRRRFLKYPID